MAWAHSAILRFAHHEIRFTVHARQATKNGTADRLRLGAQRRTIVAEVLMNNAVRFLTTPIIV
jgi:hypothetical protein